MNSQASILAPRPNVAHHLAFDLHDPAAARDALTRLATLATGDKIVVGIGLSLVQVLGKSINGLRSHPQITSCGIDTPSTPRALWCWLRSDDGGELLFLCRKVEQLLAPAFRRAESQRLFLYTADHRDLSGYVDGTQNPTGEDAIQAALVSGQGKGMDGSSFVVLQQWQHHFKQLEAIEAGGPAKMDDVMGRTRVGDVELQNKPPSSHVARTDQDSFDPPAHILRCNMPWADDDLQGGVMFIAFGHSFRAFEVQWHRMLGLDDGITDALFRFTRPITGAYFWCPPVLNGKLDLRALGM
ncbi:MAG: Dyp-type peroxidase [Xanthomonadaceae bacterium]|nr:Dyp-type peroxidase [Xanthomonadaceae bacterium]